MNVFISGASRGIGRAIAISMARRGHDLVLCCHKKEQELTDLAVWLRQTFTIRVLTFVGDVSTEAFIHKIRDNAGVVDVVVNNAAISYMGLLQDMTPSQWSTLLNTNLTSSYLTSRAFIPGMLQHGGGRILNISSMWGSRGASCEAAYSASKGGLEALTKSLAKELAPMKIPVNALACGVIDTDMNSWMSEEEREMLIEEIPMGRFGTPEEVGETAAKVLEMPVYVTGQILGIDGGF